MPSGHKNSPVSFQNGQAAKSLLVLSNEYWNIVYRDHKGLGLVGSMKERERERERERGRQRKRERDADMYIYTVYIGII